MAGDKEGKRAPDYDVCICVPRTDDASKWRYYKIGTAWLNPSGSVSLNLVTMPGVRIRLFPSDSKKAKAADDANTRTAETAEDGDIPF